MEKYNKNSIDNLAEIFIVWQENLHTQNPEADFLHQSGLNELISQDELQELKNGQAYFSEEAARAVYALLPISLKLKDVSLAIFPQTFQRLNYHAKKTAHTHVLNISFGRSEEIRRKFGPDKDKFLAENKDKLRYQNQRAKDPQMSKRAYQRRRERLSDEEKAALREQAKLRMRRYRMENPESVRICNKKAQKKLALLPMAEQISKKIDARQRNKKYREMHREEIREKQKNYQKTHNSVKTDEQIENRKKAVKKYYETHKKELIQKAKDNPKSKIYNRQYKIKKRFKEKTGVKILALLQALANTKSK